MNHGLIEKHGRVLPLGQDIRNPNGRALFDRDLIGKYVNRCSFPNVMCWLMKDITMPPIVHFTDKWLATAMGASLMTRRNQAENVSEAELKKLVFVPFANPFRVYELWKDVEAFFNVFEHGAEAFSFNSVGFWNSSDTDLTPIPLETSLTLQTAIILGELEWEDWELLPGAQLPTRDSVEKILPGYFDAYDPRRVNKPDKYVATLTDRMRRRKEFIQRSDIKDRPDLLIKLTQTLKLKN